MKIPFFSGMFLCSPRFFPWKIHGFSNLHGGLVEIPRHREPQPLPGPFVAGAPLFGQPGIGPAVWIPWESHGNPMGIPSSHPPKNKKKKTPPSYDAYGENPDKKP